MLLIWFTALIFVALICGGTVGWVQGLRKRFHALTLSESVVIVCVGVPWFYHLIGLVSIPLATISAAVALGLGLTELQIPSKLQRQVPVAAIFAFAAVGIYFLIKSFDALTPLPHGDPLTYHLRGPLQWVEDGRIRFPSEIPTAAICNLFEMFYTLVLSALAPLNHSTSSMLQIRLATQIAGQLLNLWFGLALCVFVVGGLIESVLYEITPKNQSRSFYWIIFFGWLATMVPQTEWLSVVAKNNWYATALALAPLLYFSREPRFRVSVPVTGAVLAAAYWAKATNLMAALPIGATILVHFLAIKKIQNLRSFAMTGIAVSLPFAIRNFVWTRNPFYPSELGPFKSNLISASDRLDISRFFAPFQSPLRPMFWTDMSRTIFPFLIESKARMAIASAITASAIIFLLWRAWRCAQDRQWMKLGIASLGAATALAWTGAIIGPRFFEPHIQPLLIVFRGVGVALMAFVVLAKSEKSKPLVGAACAAIALTSVNLPFHVLWKDFWPLASGQRSFVNSIYSMPHGTIYECLNAKLSPADRVVSDWLNTTYYVQGRIPSLGNAAPLEREMRSLGSRTAQLQKLREMGFTHVWLGSGCGGSERPDSRWPECSVLGPYSTKDFAPHQIICREDATFVVKL